MNIIKKYIKLIAIACVMVIIVFAVACEFEGGYVDSSSGSLTESESTTESGSLSGGESSDESNLPTESGSFGDGESSGENHSPTDPFHEYVYVETLTSPTTKTVGKILVKCECGHTTEKEIPLLSSDGYVTSKPANVKCGEKAEYIFTAEFYGTTLTFKETLEGIHTCKGGIVNFDVRDDGNGNKNPITVKEGDERFKIFGKLTCDKSGVNASFTCDECQKEYLILARKEHAPQNGIDSLEKIYTDCESSGKTENFVCKSCKKNVYITLPPIGHEYNYTISAENGDTFVDAKCKRCENIEKLKATLIRETVINEATCGKEGEKICIYSFGDKEISITVKIPKTNHKLCGKEVDFNDVFYLNFFVTTFGNLSVPYCTDEAQSGDNACFTCSDCGDMFLVKARKHLEPTDASQITVVEPTRENLGTKTYKCVKCGQTIIEYIPFAE